MGFGLEFSVIFSYVFGLALIILIGWLLIFPMKIITKLIINGLLGGLFLLAVNFIVGNFTDFSIGVNPINALIVGFLGLPGLALLIILKLIL